LFVGKNMKELLIVTLVFHAKIICEQHFSIAINSNRLHPCITLSFPPFSIPPFDFVDLKIWIGQLSKTVDMAMCLSSLSVKNLKILFFFEQIFIGNTGIHAVF